VTEPRPTKTDSTDMETETPVFLLRHAEAGVPGRWPGPDADRPLTADGRRQAELLVRRWAAQPFAHLVSSPFRRCLETIEPLAAARGLPVETREELAVGQDWEQTERLVLEAASEGPAVLCVHGETMRPLVEDLRARGIDLDGNGSGAVKGATWVLGVRDGAIRSARYEPPPGN